MGERKRENEVRKQVKWDNLHPMFSDCVMVFSRDGELLVGNTKK